jgi:hypothetical protein
MPTAPRYFLREDGRRTGPHSLAVLKQKAEMGLLSADSVLAPEAEPEEWAALRESQVLCEELIPARPHYTLGKREVEKVNHAENPATPSVEAMLRANLARQQEAEGELLKPMPPRSNRRRNDYLIVAGLINGLVLVNICLGRPWFDPFLLGFFVMGNLSLAWVMFGVMDRY